MCITDLASIDTTPGAGNPFSPPLGFEGGEDAYGAWLTARYKESLQHQQYMFVLWRFSKLAGTGQPSYQGPYAGRLKSAMDRFDRMMNAAPKVKD